jgi:2-oxoglutarate ferredoxin oxidoreductase subunit beta
MAVKFINRNPLDDPQRETVSRSILKSKKPTWCAGCGDHGVLGVYFKTLQELDLPHENIVTMAGIGCSSRFPYFCNTHGGHFIHGRAAPFSAGLSLARPDLHIFLFGGDGDGFSIGGNHLDHTARKNFNLTYVIMDNFVYGMTKNQTSPTSPIGQKSKTDPTGSLDQPIAPMKRLVASGATFVARTSTSNPKHMGEIFKRAAEHKGFSVVECMSECVHFNRGSFDDLNPRKGGQFNLVPEDHDVSDQKAAYALACDEWPGYFGVFYEVDSATKEDKELAMIANAQEMIGDKTDTDLINATFDALI